MKKNDGLVKRVIKEGVISYEDIFFVCFVESVAEIMIEDRVYTTESVSKQVLIERNLRRGLNKEKYRFVADIYALSPGEAMDRNSRIE